MRSPATCLRDFSAPRARPAPVPARRDIAAEIASAYANGQRDGRLSALTETEAARILAEEAADARACADLAGARTRWTADTAELFGNALTDALVQMRDDIEADVAAVLAEIAVLARRASLADEFVRQLQPILRDRDAVRLELSGPRDLTAAVQRQLEGTNITVGTVSDAAELGARVEKTVLGTRLASWRTALLVAIGESE